MPGIRGNVRRGRRLGRFGGLLRRARVFFGIGGLGARCALRALTSSFLPLALSFLILVGFTLILESFDIHVPKGYIYFAMFFSIAVESLNLIRNKKNPL